MPKKNKHNLDKIKWNSPPFSRSIKISDLNIKKTNKFKIILNNEEIMSLEEFLEVKAIESFNCLINLTSFGNKWEIKGNILIILKLECIISLEVLKFKLNIPVKRYLSPDINLNSTNIICYKDIYSDTDPLTENIDLGDIVSEEIYLSIPKYPKKKGVQLTKILTTEDDMKLNPFKKLESLKI
tara:strand:- start:264 stop:812 length:549 start_codon:yes stop_codon:yes gene_type:complete